MDTLSEKQNHVYLKTYSCKLWASKPIFRISPWDTPSYRVEHSFLQKVRLFSCSCAGQGPPAAWSPLFPYITGQKHLVMFEALQRILSTCLRVTGALKVPILQRKRLVYTTGDIIERLLSPQSLGGWYWVFNMGNRISMFLLHFVWSSHAGGSSDGIDNTLCLFQQLREQDLIVTISSDSLGNRGWRRVGHSCRASWVISAGLGFRGGPLPLDANSLSGPHGLGAAALAFPLGLHRVVPRPETKSGQLCFNRIESTVKEVLVLILVSSSLESVSTFYLPLKITKRGKKNSYSSNHHNKEVSPLGSFSGSLPFSARQAICR